MSIRVGPLVRATGPDSAVIWAELAQPGEVLLSATPVDSTETGSTSVQAHTVTTRAVSVGNRYYAAPQLTGLQPATWYGYSIQSGNESTSPTLPLQCFRTLDRPDTPKPLTLAYGSCRTSSDPRRDVLSAFGSWLVRHCDEREALWPRLMLLIGDQIYADEPSPASRRFNQRLRGGAKAFAEFASLYEFAWTWDKNVRQALAVLPTYMICDDHEISNDWNTTPFWKATTIKGGDEQMLVDGLVAYWVYQAWGNLRPLSEAKSSTASNSTANDPRLRIMEESASSGEDALEALRDCMRSTVHGESRLSWHYAIPVSPPLFVCDARADREARLDKTPASPGPETPARIMSRSQMTELSDWLKARDDQVALVVSSVPVLLPPLIGLAEYVMGNRRGQQSKLRWRIPARLQGRRQQNIGMDANFDHWPLFNETWNELVEILATRRSAVLFLSGDVHFSYAMEARLTKAVTTSGIQANRQASLLQFVCSPLENRLGTRSRRQVLAQSWFKRATYGGLSTRVLHLHKMATENDRKQRIHRDLLLGNTLAILTLQPQEDGTCKIVQKYLGSYNGRLEAIAQSAVRTGHHL